MVDNQDKEALSYIKKLKKNKELNLEQTKIIRKNKTNTKKEEYAKTLTNLNTLFEAYNIEEYQNYIKNYTIKNDLKTRFGKLEKEIED